MTQFRLTLEYDGTNYSGWQLQSGQDSVQAQLEAALAQIFGTRLRVYGAGRTDAGVHALGQVATFRTPRPFDCVELKRALNAILPPDIAVRDAVIASDNFDPRRAARSRVYEYHILTGTTRSAFEYRYSWLVREPLDLDAMNSAAEQFLGEHDFAAMRSVGSDEKTTARRVFKSEWYRDVDDRLIYHVEATAFLRHMVRTMVGLMVAIGMGRLADEEVSAILKSRDRSRAPAAAPACGLFLVEVRY
jgi:tRNA pseudouridine38-40 synthase